MEKRILDKVEYKDHLPEDVWPNILSRLPSKSLVRFRCVSKSFKSLIMDPDFHRLHLKSFKNNVDESHLLVVVKRQQNSEVRCSKSWETKSDAHFNLGGKWVVECSIDGLVLLKTLQMYRNGGDLMLWNPSIRKFHTFPRVPKAEKDVEIGLGYDQLSKVYKHIKLILKNDSYVPHSLAVYTLGVGVGSYAWKIIPFQAKGFSNWHWTCGDYCMGSVYLRGCLYFLALKDDTNMPELVWIDLSSEVFSSTNLPDDASTMKSLWLLYYSLQLALVDGRCSLALCDFMHVHKSMWVLDSESSMAATTWTKRYSFELMSVPRLLCIKKNGNVLLTRENQDTDIVLLYDPETKEEKILREKECSGFYISNVYGYIESLVLLK